MLFRKGYQGKLIDKKIVFIFVWFLFLFGIRGIALAAVTGAGVKGRVVKSSNPSAGISGIEVIAYEADHKLPTGHATTDADGYYEIKNLENWLPLVESEKEFYVCAKDPLDKYITECYDGFFWFSSKESSEGGGTAVMVIRGQVKENINFELLEGGDISVTLDLPHYKGHKIILEGIINYKKSINSPFNRELYFWDPNNMPTVVSFKEQLNIDPLPYGRYKIKVEDVNVSNYNAQVFYTSYDEYTEMDSYNPYKINDYNNFFSQYYNHASSAQQATEVTLTSTSLKKQVTFSSFSEAGIIYGILADPNTGEFKSPNCLLSTIHYNCDQSVNYWEDPNNVDMNMNSITLGVDKDCMSEGINHTKMQIIPLNNQEMIFPETIPSKIFIDSSQDRLYVTGQYGGYAFKFLKPGDYKIRVFRQVGNTDILSLFYGNVYTQSESPAITIDAANKNRRLDFVLPAAKIKGKVTVNGGSVIKANVNLLTTNYEEIKSCPLSTDGYFEFNEVISGNFIIRVAPDNNNYMTKKINLSNLRLGDNKNLNIILDVFQKPTGTGKIKGRVFKDENQGAGLANISVTAVDIDYIEQWCSWKTTTDANGNYTIAGLPSSGFIVYTLTDSSIVAGNYFDEMHENVTAFPFESENPRYQYEVDLLGEKVNAISTNAQDPNNLVTVVLLGEGQQKTVNFGLSAHQYSFFKGLNLFAYPGTPLSLCNSSEKLIDNFDIPYYQGITDYCVPHYLLEMVPSSTGGNEWLMTYLDPNDWRIKGDDFPIASGHGYIFYLKTDVADFQIPPFTIDYPTISLLKGINIISMPSGFDRGYCAQNILTDLSGNGGATSIPDSATITNYDVRAGKWTSMTWLWKKPSGKSFKIERERGYLLYMREPAEWVQGVK